MRFASSAMVAAISLAAVTLPAAADSLDLNLSNDSARLTFAKTLQEQDQSNVEWDAGFLYTEDDANETISMGHLGIHSTGDAGAAPHRVNVGLGGRVLWIASESLSDLNSIAVAVGAKVDATLKGYSRIGFGGSVYYAPDVTSFGDLDSALEYQVWVGYELQRAGELYVNWRQVKAEHDVAGDFTVDSGMNVGIRIKF